MNSYLIKQISLFELYNLSGGNMATPSKFFQLLPMLENFYNKLSGGNTKQIKNVCT